jgi:isovaleryl-CoA dehydrogenase
MWDTEVNRHYRNAKVTTIGGGTAEVRKLIIAQELLASAGLSREQEERRHVAGR